MQQIWSRKFEWDEPLPGDIQVKWQKLVRDLKQTLTIEISRFYFKQSSCDFSQKTKQLHVFTDASQNAYGSCAYIVSENQSTLVMAKNRVALLKQITLARFELMGAVLGVRLAKHIIENIGDMEINFWCDSQIVLSWIDSTKSLKKFIANRVKEIKELVKNQMWRYCPTDENPADLLTRGTSAEKFMQSKMWMHGPNWISKESLWPIWNGHVNTTPAFDSQETELSTTLVVPSHTESLGIDRIIDIERFGSLKRLLRVTAYVYRFLRNCRTDTNQRNLSTLSTTEIHKSLIVWIRNVQEKSLNIDDNSNQRSSIIRQLKLFKDENYIFRSGGRIDNSYLSENAKYPYLLPSKHPFTNLVILDSHINQLHSGAAQTVTHIRQNYWIPRIRQIVRTVLRKCVTCRKVVGKSYPKPDPPPLPKSRVDEPIPFNVTVVDFAGPLHVKDKQNTKLKVYLCLFTCATTRAVHLEIVTNLTEESFMLAFRKFASRKSVPKLMMSDNASTFIAASKEVKQLSQSLEEKLTEYGTEWKSIPSRAPWYGKFWERLIGLTKITLKKVLGMNCVNLETLQTVITEVEAVLNDRPITYVTTEQNDLEPLTPSHFLCGRRTTCLPYPTDFTEYLESSSVSPPTRTVLTQRMQRQQEIIRQFQLRWKSEYLTALREYHRAVAKNNQTVKVGDVIQIHDDVPRIHWKLGIVDELCYGKDGLIRSVKIRAKNGFTTRPITKLYLLEVSDSEPQSSETTERKSKTTARSRICEWTSPK